MTKRKHLGSRKGPGGRQGEGVDQPNSLIEHTLKVSLCQSGAFEILVSFNVFRTSQRLLVRHRLHTLRAERVYGGAIVTQIELGSDQDDWDIRSMMIDFREPLCIVSISIFGL